MAAGDFTASVWPEVQVKALEMWENPRIRQRIQRPVEAAKGFIENQQVRFDDVLTQGQCIGVKATWLKDCDYAVTDDSSTDVYDCTIAGAEAESDSTVYDTNLGFYREFQVNNEDCNNQFTYADKVAEQLLKEKAAMDQELNKRILGFVDGAAAATGYTDGLASVVGTASQIETKHWDVDLMGEFAAHAAYNDMAENSYFISGNNFFNGAWNAEYEALNDDQKDRIAKYGAFGQWYFDLRDMISEIGAGFTYMVDPGAAGFFDNVKEQSLSPVSLGDKDATMQWMVTSDNLVKPDGTPVRYGIVARHTCSRNGVGLTTNTNFRITLHGGLYQSPNPCTIHSGILEFEKIADAI